MVLRRIVAVSAIMACGCLIFCQQPEKPPRPTTAGRTPRAGTFRAATFQFDMGGPRETIQGATTTAAFFEDGNTLPLLGRRILPQEYKERGPQVVVLSYAFWQRQFKGDPTCIGKTIHLNGRSFTI